MKELLRNYIISLRELYNKLEDINFEIPELYEQLIIEFFEPIKVRCIIGSGIFPVITRVTINKRVVKDNLRIYDIRELMYPPSNCVNKYGRANLKKQSVFYGSFNFMTAIKEMKPEIGDLITVSEWKVRNESSNLITCPIFMNQPKDGTINIRLLDMYDFFIQDLKRFPSDVSKLIFDIHSFYANCFARKIDSNNHQGYIYTALLADKILNQYKDGIVDAIIYPSTQENLRTENIVIKKDAFDKKYTFLKATEKKLIGCSAAGDRYMFEILGESKKIDGESIQWN